MHERNGFFCKFEAGTGGTLSASMCKRVLLVSWCLTAEQLLAEGLSLGCSSYVLRCTCNLS